MKKDEFIAGGSAFPHANHREADSNGMSLRDYFAAKALALLIPKADQMIEIHEEGKLRGKMTLAEYAAMNAYAIADAMLKQRSTPQEGER